MVVTKDLLVFLLVVSATHITAKPFLYNPKVITDFLSSASAASGNPGPSENIADFTKNAHPHPKKLQQQDAKPADPDDDDDFFKDVDLSPEEPGAMATQNEVLPGIIQKKIGKILRKIQLISSFANSGGSSGNDGGTNPEATESSDEYFDNAFNETTEKPSPSATEDEDDKKAEFELVNVVSQQVLTEKPTPQSAFPTNPGSFAVFLMELVGSIFGLAYGAAAQLTQGRGDAKP